MVMLQVVALEEEVEEVAVVDLDRSTLLYFHPWVLRREAVQSHS